MNLLTKILFTETVPAHSALKELQKAFGSSSGKHLVHTVGMMADQFYSINKPIFDRILSSASSFKFLGGGMHGLAFDLGNQTVLKIDSPSSPFSDEKNQGFGKIAQDVLWQQKKPTSSLLMFPMVYDRGTFKTNDSTGKTVIQWYILEKFETISTDDPIFNVLDRFLFMLAYRLSYTDKTGEPLLDEVLADLGPRKKMEIDDMGRKFRLVSDWKERVVKEMKALMHDYSLADFHAGNVGIRRIGAGGLGYLVWFDP